MERIGSLLASVAMLLTLLAVEGSPVVSAQADVSSYAFVDANVVTMAREEVLQHQTVIVAGDRIVAIGPVGQVEMPANVIKIDGAGRYLMPGLIDAHLHLVSEHDLPLLLSYGVTTVRNMNGRPQHLRWRDEVASGDRLGPRIITAGPMLGELPPHLRPESNADIVGAIAKRVVDQKSLGYDFIKVGDGLTSTELAAAVDAAEQQGMDVVGHVPDGMRLSDLLAYGLRSLEHLDGLAALSEEQLRQLLPEMADNPIWIAPTLTIWQQFRPVDGEMGRAQIALSDYMAHTGRSSRCLAESAFEHPHALSRPSSHRIALVDALHDAHIPLLLGTDAPFLCTTPGESVHQELVNFVDAGLSAYEALRTATYNPADCLRKLDEFGTVEIGKRADLLLLKRNPLEDVSVVREIAGVMVRGQWLPVEQLQELLGPGL